MRLRTHIANLCERVFGVSSNCCRLLINGAMAQAQLAGMWVEISKIQSTRFESATKKCGTCKHFKTESSHQGNQPEGYGSCSRLKQAERHGPQPENEIALTEDGSDYYSALLCTKDFGCVLHDSAGGPSDTQINISVQSSNYGRDTQQSRS